MARPFRYRSRRYAYPAGSWSDPHYLHSSRSTAPPVSATRKFAPVMPTSADRNFSRNTAARLKEHFACFRRRRIAFDTMAFMKCLTDLLERDMQGRRENMTRFLATQLDDVLAQIGLGHFVTGGFERRIEFDFFADHRFALDDPASADGFAQSSATIIPCRLFTGPGPVHVPARLDDLLFELPRVSVQTENRILSHAPCPLQHNAAKSSH